MINRLNRLFLYNINLMEVLIRPDCEVLLNELSSLNVNNEDLGFMLLASAATAEENHCFRLYRLKGLL